MKLFKDRESAGILLAKRLKKTQADLVLGIPRGGVVVAKEIAKSLKLPLDIVVVRKIGAPGQEELALGAVDPDGQVLWDENLLRDLGFKIYDLGEKIRNEWKELKRREDTYSLARRRLARLVADKTVILVDDGVATGSTVLSAVTYLKRHGGKVVLAVPVASKESTEKLKTLADEVVVLEKPENFQAVGQFYQEFLPVSDKEVIQLLSYGG